MNIQIELSLYPLGVEHLGQPIEEFVQSLENEGLKVELGRMSSIVEGECKEIFPLLGEVFDNIAGRFPCVLLIKASNSCPTGIKNKTK